MRPDLANYAGREQAYVKHHFLADYVERLVFKVASAYKDVVYIDGFSGPWKDQGQRLEDTSFGIALKALQKAKVEWKRIRGLDVTMTALLVEKDSAAFCRLEEVKALYPGINIRTFNGEFVPQVEDLIRAIPPRAFTFVLMDPKGWKIDMNGVAPLIRRANAEVVLNFMFDFINRFASMEQPAVQAGLDALLPGTDWRRRIMACKSDSTGQGAESRKDVLTTAIIDVIRRLGGYQYVMETPVLYPTKDRTFYSLIYATRSKVGVDVFRECQHDALKAQDLVRHQLKSERRAATTMMKDMFVGVPTGNEFATRWIAKQESAARKMVVDVVPHSPEAVRYGDVWPQVLASHGIRRRRLGRLMAEMRDLGELNFPDWGGSEAGPRRRLSSDSLTAHFILSVLTDCYYCRIVIAIILKP